eukprot:m.780788 g.780788  ORF g.780788 m.780788 type:complete len:1081 (-) comp23284_c0_seq2:209-3451(-)
MWDKVAAIFDRVQRSAGVSALRKQLVELRKVQNDSDFDEFFTVLRAITNNLLVVLKREPSVERCIDFLVKFVSGMDTSSDDEHDFNLLNPFLEHVLKWHGAKDKAVRFRVCQITSRLLHALPEEAELDDDVMDEIEKVGLTRCKDKMPAIRMQAANMITRLQDPSDVDDEVTNQYLHMLQTDSSPDVRKGVLSQMAPSKKTLPAVLAVTRDKAPIVRREAYRYIRFKVDVKALTVSDRLKLLQEGLEDRADDVRKECVGMLCEAWYCADAENPLAAACTLLQQLDVVTATATSLKAATEIIQFVRDWSLTAEAFDDLTCEAAFFWRALVEYASQRRHYDLIEAISPSVPQFADVVGVWSERCAATATAPDAQMQAEFIATQLLTLAHHFDYADEAGRTKMLTKIREVLQIPTLPESIVQSAVGVLGRLCHTEDDRIQMLAETVEDLRHPIQQRTTVAEARARARARQVRESAVVLRLTECKMALEEHVKHQRYADAGAVKKEIEALEAERAELQQPDTGGPDDDATPPAATDPATICACLRIVKHLLLTTTCTLARPELKTLLNNVVIPSIKSTDPELRGVALTCLGMCCVLSPTPALATQYLDMFYVLLKLDQDVIKVTVLKALFDLVLAFGTSPFAAANGAAEGEGGALSIVDVLQAFLHNEDEDIRTVAVEGFAKLLMHNHVTCPSVASQMVELYFNPMTKDDQRLQQCLSVFFPAYAFSSTSHAAVLEAAFLPTLRRVMHAPKDSPLYAVKDLTVARFFVYHTSQTEGVGVGADEDALHETLSVKVLNEMLSNPTGNETKVLASVLSMLSINACSPLVVQNLAVLTELLLKSVTNRAIQKKIKEFTQRVLELNTAGEPSEEQRETLTKMMEQHLADKAAEIGNDGTDASDDDEYKAPDSVRRSTRRAAPDAGAPAASVRPSTARRAAAVARRRNMYVDDDSDGSADEISGNGTADGADVDAAVDASDDAGSASEEESYVVEAILDARKRGRKNEYLVKWEGYNDASNSWEPEVNIAVDLVRAYKQSAKAKNPKSKRSSNAENTSGTAAKRDVAPRAKAVLAEINADDVDDADLLLM